jgi:DHA2 family multidrug resistance protein
VGLAVINTVLDHRTDLHISRLHERVNWGNSVAVETLNMLTQKFQGAGNASLMALKQLSQIVHRQAVVMSFGDAFFILTCFIWYSAPWSFVRKPNMMGPPPDAH